MYPRTNYEMTEADLQEILDACKPVPAMMIGGTTPSSPAENANRAWERLGKKMGFDYMTVQPIDGKGYHFFTAIPSENETQREERLKREAEEKKNAEIAKLKAEIIERETRLSELTECKGIDLGDGNFSGCNGTGGDCPECGN
jgi:hypothetical protein